MHFRDGRAAIVGVQRSLLSVKGMIHFLYPDRKRSIALSVRQSYSPSPPPGISKLNTPTIYTYY